MLLSMSLAGDAKSSDGNTPKENPVATNSWRMCTHIVNCGHELPKKGAEMTLAGPIPVAASPKTSQQGIPAVFLPAAPVKRGPDRHDDRRDHPCLVRDP